MIPENKPEDSFDAITDLLHRSSKHHFKEFSPEAKQKMAQQYLQDLTPLMNNLQKHSYSPAKIAELSDFALATTAYYGISEEHYLLTYQVMQYCLDQGLSVNHIYPDTSSLLIKACVGDFYPLVKDLLDAGADVNYVQHRVEDEIDEEFFDTALSHSVKNLYHSPDHDPEAYKISLEKTLRICEQLILAGDKTPLHYEENPDYPGTPLEEVFLEEIVSDSKALEKHPLWLGLLAFKERVALLDHVPTVPKGKMRTKGSKGAASTIKVKPKSL